MGTGGGLFLYPEGIAGGNAIAKFCEISTM